MNTITELFHVRTPRVQEPKQLDIKKISHVKNPQKGSDWMKSTVNFGKIRFRNKKPAGASEVTLTSGVMYHVKLRIWKEGGEEKIFEIDYQYFVACSYEFEPTETASRQGPPHEKMPSTSDNSVMPLLDLPELQALGAFPSIGNCFQLHQMNLMPALQTFVANTNFQTLRGRIPERLSQQGAGPFLNTQHVNTEQNQPETMPSRSDNFEFSLSPLFELQIANGMLPHIYPEFAYSVAQALHSISNQPQAGQVLTVPPPVNIIQPQVVVEPIEEPPINLKPEQELPRHPEQD
ncbi:Protein CBG21789 [Caenorhabditis briggsae]|uniref:Protein CBG21789 n=1 Tax=Caenorhabditis briggsae TaxID=6238 RepID=A8Y0H3_CAEBR|nr:Protein CBG21789 [Caenorhabditis briggsae]CAP38391.2 Protein CBG21789 [Caenorhabditis briggsae]